MARYTRFWKKAFRYLLSIGVARGNSGDSAVLEYAGEKRKRENKGKKGANYWSTWRRKRRTARGE
ncbi:hypothetical protein X777_03792 [Ooceraea biroi]|uniref:Uncharacterized protein n=1 Tax=Ooceraea biroi TaxID=2015173 RepID=A0A026WHR5_OOCBI|nr:hypothetical protein X777_03792 [Ooceraea biroi]